MTSGLNLSDVIEAGEAAIQGRKFLPGICYDEKRDGVTYHIPGCTGCAVGGHERCTCITTLTKDELVKTVLGLEYQLAKARETIQTLWARGR